MDDATAIELPEGAEALKALCATLLTRVAEKDATLADREARLSSQQAQIETHEARIAWLMAQLLKLRKRLYGPRADRLSAMAERVCEKG